MSVWASSKTQSYQLPAERARTFPAQCLIRRRPLVWLNLVCLDAPIVAVLWQAMFARTFHFELPVASRIALFLTAWLIYLADRFADAMVLSWAVPKSLRQEFCLRHRGFWSGLLISVAAINAFVIWSRLDHQVFVRGFWPGSAAIVYLAVNCVFGKLWRFLPLKEVAIGFLFAAGAVLVSFDQATTSFFSAFLLFGCLCALNCIGIAIWERDLDQAQSKHTLATRWSGIRMFFRIASFGLIITGLILGLSDRNFTPTFGCIVLSALFLFFLDLDSKKIRRDDLTALADLALFTPLIGLLLK